MSYSIRLNNGVATDEVAMHHIKLNNGIELPMIGFGTYQIPASKTARCVADALSVGYRLIDTAQCYGNESEVGEAVRASCIPREEIFITTKLWGTRGFNDTVVSIDKSLKRLDTYIDLLLLHEPTGNYHEIYRAMENALEEGKVRSIGVANFIGKTFIGLADNCDVVPAVNQIETHVFRQQDSMKKLLDNYGTMLQSWSPLACGQNGIFQNSVLKQIADKHDKTIAQVSLRWLIQRGIPIIPKSTHKERMEENIQIFDFVLSEEEMKIISTLDLDRSMFNWW